MLPRLQQTVSVQNSVQSLGSRSRSKPKKLKDGDEPRIEKTTTCGPKRIRAEDEDTVGCILLKEKLFSGKRSLTRGVLPKML